MMILSSSTIDVGRYIDKMHRVLYFLNTFSKLDISKEMMYNSSYIAYVYELNTKFFISIPLYDKTSIEIGRIECSTTYDENYQMIKSYPCGDTQRPICSSFYNDDYYSDFIYFNNKNADIVLTVSDEFEDEVIGTPSLSLSTEEGRFQLKCMYSDHTVNVLQVHQYFLNVNQESFCCWFHPEFEELYEVLNEQFGIGKKDYLPSN